MTAPAPLAKGDRVVIGPNATGAPVGVEAGVTAVLENGSVVVAAGHAKYVLARRSCVSVGEGEDMAATEARVPVAKGWLGEGAPVSGGTMTADGVETWSGPDADAPETGPAPKRRGRPPKAAPEPADHEVVEAMRYTIRQAAQCRLSVTALRALVEALDVVEQEVGR